MSTFEELMRKQQEASADSQISEAAKNAVPGANSGVKDDRFWKPTIDKAGNSYAVVRFLPSPDSDIPWAKYWEHFFRGETGKYFVEKCPTSLGKECFVCSKNTERWNSGKESDKSVARARKRNLYYVSNIYVVKDTGNPENEGKQFLYRYGAKIFEKLMEAMSPQFEDDEPMNPFNLFNGAPLKLKIKTIMVDGGSYLNYDSSEFGNSEKFLGGDEAKLRVMFNNLYPIKEFTDPANYKTEEELKVKFLTVTGEGKEEMSSMSSLESRLKNEKTADAPSSFNQRTSEVEETSSQSTDDDDDDDMEYFRRIAAEA
jgi:hypothetical protein